MVVRTKPLKQRPPDLLPPIPVGSADGAAEMAELESHLADTPGIMNDIPREAAVAFANSYSADFEGVFWIDCTGRSRAGVLGDTGQALGLKLIGDLDQNRIELNRFVAGPRCLFVFDNLRAEDRDLLLLDGRASVIFTAPSPVSRKRLPLDEAVALFSRWRRDPPQCLPHLGDAADLVRILNTNCSAANATLIKSLGASMFSLLKHHERLAEAYELLEILSRRAFKDGDEMLLRNWESEKGWIQEAWGGAASVPLRLGIATEPAQLDFGF